jgi:hypothetical protein
VHAGNGKAHDATGQQIGSALAQAGQLAQAKAYPQRQGGQQNGNQQRKHEPARRIAQDGSHLHGGHAGVVHATYARPHQQAAQQQLPMADLGRRQHVERHPGRTKGRQDG